MKEGYYLTIESPVKADFRDRGSKFLSFAFPVSTKEEFKIKLAELKKQHPKAAHHCFAYRFGTEGNEFRVSDDGEPSGTAGRPILGQIDSNQLTNVLVIVVRYFGGTLLGVPGLINAYKTSTALAISQASIVEKPILVSIEIEFDYTKMNDVMRIIKLSDSVIQKQELQLFYRISLGVHLNKLKEVKAQFENLLVKPA
jgi:uncharacterized YigZ family protein